MMKPINRQIILLSTTAFALCLPRLANAEEEFARTDRYTLAKVEARSDQRAPLTTVVTLSFGVDITTVGEAIVELLKGSGYQWAIGDSDQGDHLLNSLFLPAISRTLGPIRLEDALTTLAGNAWGLQVDELHRTVSFTEKNSVIAKQ
jgi:conjugative transfer region protein (TIGR03748 family)